MADAFKLAAKGSWALGQKSERQRGNEKRRPSLLDGSRL
jgi:hypothetical protein